MLSDLKSHRPNDNHCQQFSFISFFFSLSSRYPKTKVSQARQGTWTEHQFSPFNQLKVIYLLFLNYKIIFNLQMDSIT